MSNRIMGWTACFFILGAYLMCAGVQGDLSLPDAWENDGSPETASVFYLFSTSFQSHNFHDPGDEDWVRFYSSVEFGAVEIKTYDPEENAETVISLFDSDQATLLKEQSRTLSGGIGLMSFRPDEDGVYYIRIKNKDPLVYGMGTGYRLAVYLPVAPYSGTVDGIVSDRDNGLEGVSIIIGNDISATVTESDGFYFLQGPAGKFTLKASKKGYWDYYADIEINEMGRTEHTFSLQKKPGLTQTQVSQLYVAIFGRASEGEGNRFWQAWQPEGALKPDTASTAAKMLDTQAAREYFGTGLDTDQAFIEHIYLNTLNKTPTDDSSGIAYWVGELGKGKSRGEVVATLVGVIKDYAPNGPYFNPNDPKTIAAYNQFTNRVTVSNYMADTVEQTPSNWATATQFSLSGLYVTDDPTTVVTAKAAVDAF